MADIQIDLTEPSQTVQVRPGDSVRLCLAESPTTGYLWELLEALPSGVVEEPAVFEGGGGAIGEAGKRCFALRFRVPIEIRLTYVLRRPWAPDQIEKRVSVRLVCTD